MEAVSFNPEVNLTHDERGQLAHVLAHPGFHVFHKIMRAEVDKFIVNLINAPEDDDRLVVARHKLAKSAAQFHYLVMGRANSEAGQFVRDASGGSAPTDPTEGLIDMGEYAKPGEEPSDLLEGFELNPQLLEEELTHE